MLHVTCTQAHDHAQNILVLAIETPTSRCAIRGIADPLAIGLFFCDTPRVLHSVLNSFLLFGHNIAKLEFVELLLYYTTFIGADMDLPCYRRQIASSAPGVQNEQLQVHGVRCRSKRLANSRFPCTCSIRRSDARA